MIFSLFVFRQLKCLISSGAVCAYTQVCDCQLSFLLGTLGWVVRALIPSRKLCTAGESDVAVRTLTLQFLFGLRFNVLQFFHAYKEGRGNLL